MTKKGLKIIIAIRGFYIHNILPYRSLWGKYVQIKAAIKKINMRGTYDIRKL